MDGISLMETSTAIVSSHHGDLFAPVVCGIGTSDPATGHRQAFQGLFHDDGATGSTGPSTGTPTIGNSHLERHSAIPSIGNFVVVGRLYL